MQRPNAKVFYCLKIQISNLLIALRNPRQAGGLRASINILGICPKRLPLQELTNELQNRKIDYGNQNKRRKLVEILDKELTYETLENKGNYIYLQ